MTHRLLAIQPLGDIRPFATEEGQMVYRDLAWRDNPEPDDQPTAAEIALEMGDGQDEPVLVVPLEFFTGDDQSLPNELFDAPPHEQTDPQNEDWYIDQYAE